MGKLELFGETTDSTARISQEESKIYSQRFIYSTKEFPLEGKHNLENLAAVFYSARLRGVCREDIQKQFLILKVYSFVFKKIKSGMESYLSMILNPPTFTACSPAFLELRAIHPLSSLLGGKQRTKSLVL